MFIFGNVPFDEIVFQADGRRFDAPETVVDDDQGFGNIEKSIGLVFREDFLKAVVIFFLSF
ncbi:MAG: hypothetical protein MZV70_65670 [Desulfobacterales bacterium]|nr:hypothetical protein [Desulfobacterales bacterium]